MTGYAGPTGRFGAASEPARRRYEHPVGAAA
jgi:hypothetical protein